MESLRPRSRTRRLPRGARRSPLRPQRSRLRAVSRAQVLDRRVHQSRASGGERSGESRLRRGRAARARALELAGRKPAGARASEFARLESIYDALTGARPLDLAALRAGLSSQRLGGCTGSCGSSPSAGLQDPPRARRRGHPRRTPHGSGSRRLRFRKPLRPVFPRCNGPRHANRLVAPVETALEALSCEGPCWAVGWLFARSHSRRVIRCPTST